MNILEIITLVMAAGMVLSGFQKGLVKKLASLVSLILTIVLVSACLPHMTAFLKEETPVYLYLEEECGRVIHDKIKGTDLLHLSDGQQMQVVDQLPLPGFVREQIKKNNTREGYLQLKVSNFADYLIRYLANMILNALAFLIVTALIQILIWIVIRFFDLLTRLPGISLLNRLGGGAVGLVQALFLLWLFFLLLSVFSGTEIGMQLLSQVQESMVLGRIYETNLFMKLVLRIAAIFG